MNVREHLAYHWVTDLIRRGIINPGDFISSVWPFEAVAAAYDEVRRGTVLKGFVRVTA